MTPYRPLPVLPVRKPMAVCAWTEVHPSTIAEKRAHCEATIVYGTPRPPLERNRTIVDTTDFMIGTPGEGSEVLRSGAWSTLRYARRCGKKIVIVFPDGSVRIRKAVAQ